MTDRVKTFDQRIAAMPDVAEAEKEGVNIPKKVARETLEVRQNLLLANTKPRCAKYLNCKITQGVLQAGEQYDEEGNAVSPEFESTYLNNCFFTDLSETASILFTGKVSLVNCTFLPGQKVVIDTDEPVTIIGCKNANIVLNDTSKTYQIVSDGSEIAFPQYTTAYKVKLEQAGGKLTMPSTLTYATFKLNVSNAIVIAGNQIYSGLTCTGCTVQCTDELFVRKAESCNLFFDGNLAQNIVLNGGVYVGNFVENGNYITGGLANKTGVTFNADICIGNRVNMLNLTMTKGYDCHVLLGNYNGDTVDEE